MCFCFRSFICDKPTMFGTSCPDIQQCMCALQWITSPPTPQAVYEAMCQYQHCCGYFEPHYIRIFYLLVWTYTHVSTCTGALDILTNTFSVPYVFSLYLCHIAISYMLGLNTISSCEIFGRHELNRPNSRIARNWWGVAEPRRKPDSTPFSSQSGTTTWTVFAA